MRTLLLASTAALIGAGAAQAATVTLEQAPPSDQQTEQTYCVIGDNSCEAIGALPGGYTTLDPNVSSYDEVQSPTYDVGQIRDVLSTDVFSVGIDINEANGQGAQTLSFFGMYLDDDGDDHNDDDDSDTLLYAFDPGEPVEVPDINNGNGFTDYFLNEFSLEGLDNDDDIYFVATMPVINDGREQFYIVDTGTIDPIPLPASAFLLLGGLGGLGLLGRIRKKAA